MVVHVSTEVQEPRRQVLVRALLRFWRATSNGSKPRSRIVAFPCTPDVSHRPKANSCNYFHVKPRFVSMAIDRRTTANATIIVQDVD
jgi:hypothetical protein